MTDSISNAMQEPTQINPQDLRETVDHTSSISAEYEGLMGVIELHRHYTYWEQRMTVYGTIWLNDKPYPEIGWVWA